MKRIVMGGLLPLLFSVTEVSALPSLPPLPSLSSVIEPIPLDRAALSNIHQVAKEFTVKILVGDTNGSGVIIGQSGNTYRVVTNAHVVTRAKSYKIQTPDGKVYAGQLLEMGSSSQGNDLAILSFESPVNYGIATFADGVTLKPNDVVYGAGFPIGSGDVESKIKQVSARVKLSEARWNRENVPQILRLRCGYLNRSPLLALKLPP